MRKRTFIFLLAGLLAAGAIWLARGSLSHRALASVLTNASPTEQAMTEYVATSPDAAAALRELWATRRIQPRLFVLGYLRDNHDQKLWLTCRPIILEATRCRDSEFQQSALAILWERKDAEATPTALALLKSADPEVRLAGLAKLSLLRDKAHAAAFARLLADSDPQVEAVAASSLRNLTGLDFGTRLAPDATTPIPGIEKWQQWWQQNQPNFPPETAAPAADETSPAEAFAFQLPDLQGRPLRLSDCRGKRVLLSFWATWCPSCTPELATLRELQARHPQDLLIIGINVDGVSDADDHDPAPTPAELAETRAKIVKQLADAAVTHPTLLDPQGKALGPYGAENLPTNVLIGADGTIQRRLLGTRTLAAWEQLLAAPQR